MAYPAPINEYPWHQQSWDKVVSARSQNHLPHALLLTGSEGTGKLDFAEKIVRSLLCTSPIDNKACHNCQSCKTYQSGANPDFLKIELLEGKQQISVDQVRQLSEFINYTRSFNAYRVILLHPAERMNQNSANSLLKSLEEPSDNTVIILVATNLGNMLPTIKSRCQILALPAPDNKEALTWLKAQTPSSSNVEVRLSMSNGQPLTALNITDEEIQSKEDLLTELLGICSHQLSVTEIAKKWEKFDHAMMLNWQILWIQNFIKNNVIDESPADSLDNNHDATLAKLNQTLSTETQWELYQQLIKQKQYIHTSVNSLLFVENMLLLWLQASNTN